jgi:predicted N-acetyltransferase YhbS
VSVLIRPERPEDYTKVENIDREAFWNQSVNCNEHFLTHKLRASADFIPELNFVAEIDGVLAGHIIYSKSKIVSADSVVTDTITFGPLGVLPEFQNIGVGKALLQRSISAAAKLGYSAIVIHGEPDYYPRVGFRRASEFDLDGATFDAFMVYPLREGALDGVSGAFRLSSVYTGISPEEVAAFDSTFPNKERTPLAMIDVLLDKLSPSARAIIKSRNIPTLAKLRESSGREVGQWGAFSNADKSIINAVMLEYGYGKKVWDDER